MEAVFCVSYLIFTCIIGILIVKKSKDNTKVRLWTGSAPVIWGIYRNIPFTVLGLLVVVLFFVMRKDKYFRWMWLAVLLSFAFYLPVVLWADVSPMIGMLMLPKTCMYIWMVLMGYKMAKDVANA